MLLFMNELGFEESAILRAISPEIAQRPKLGSPVAVIGHGTGGDIQAQRDLSVCQFCLVFQAQDFFEFSHSNRPRRHALSSGLNKQKVRV
jgi:hypothetical protein